jgi:hypothetical protein
MLSKKHQEMLKDASSKGEGAIDFASAIIKKEAPEMFHTDESLKDRVFFDQPANYVKMASFVHPYKVEKLA